MEKGITFAIDWHIAKAYGVKAAALMGWIFQMCQQAVKEHDPLPPAKNTQAYRGRGWVHVSQTELAHHLHLTRQTVAKILCTLIDAGLIQSATSYTDDAGCVHYREAYPLVKGENKRCNLLSKENQRYFAKANRKRCITNTPLAKANRCYTITDDGFRAMGLLPREWIVRNHDALLFWGAAEAVCAKVGVSAAVVFQYFWFCTHNWHFTHTKKDSCRRWLSYTAASLSRWIVFMSDDVILDCLHRLEAAGLIMRRKKGRMTQWAVDSAGYIAMGETVPYQSADATHEGTQMTGPVARGQSEIRAEGKVCHRLAHIFPKWHSKGRHKSRSKRLRRLQR